MNAKNRSQLQTPKFNLICAWCKRMMGETTVEHSHGICDRCYLRAMIISRVSPLRIEDLPFGVMVLDAKGDVTAHNESEDLKVHFQRSDLNGLNFFADLLKNEQADGLRRRYQRFLRSKDPLLQFDLIYESSGRQTEVGIIVVRISEHQAALAITRTQADRTQTHISSDAR